MSGRLDAKRVMAWCGWIAVSHHRLILWHWQCADDCCPCRGLFLVLCARVMRPSSRQCTMTLMLSPTNALAAAGNNA